MRALSTGRVLALALLLVSGDAFAAKKEKAPPPPPPPPAASTEGLSASDIKKLEKLHAEAFADYDTNLASGQKARAADALVAIVQNETYASFHAEAYGKLGDLFRQLDLPYAAITAWTKAFNASDDTNAGEIGLWVPKALETARKVGDVAILEEPFSKNLALARTEDVRGEMAYLAAKEAFHKQSYGLATGMLKLVKEGDPVYPDAKALEGVIMNLQSRPTDALIPFEKAQKAGRDKDQRFQDLVSINIARSYYAAENFPRAIQAYAAVSRGSAFWPQAQFERGWAHFRINDMQGALAILYSLDTPFFEDWYFPEADLLRIYSMFLMCKFPEADSEIGAFRSKYKDLQSSLSGWSGKSDADSFEIARTYVKKGKHDPLPRAILRPYATDDRFLTALATVESADDELDRLKAVSANPFSDAAREWVQERRDAVIKAEGARIRGQIEAQEADITAMMGDTEIFGLDILRMKTMLYSQAAETGKMAEAARTVQREERIRKGFREWPFEGEIWADELGYYRVDAAPECPVGMRVGEKQ
jgi:hypothetical protein